MKLSNKKYALLAALPEATALPAVVEAKKNHVAAVLLDMDLIEKVVRDHVRLYRRTRAGDEAVKLAQGEDGR